MNERIRKLAEQANLTEIVDDAYRERDDWQPFVERFAKLIVMECLVPFSSRPADKCTNFECMANDYAIGGIKHHFGVEE